MNSAAKKRELTTLRFKFGDNVSRFIPYAIFTFLSLFSTFHFVFAAINFIFCLAFILLMGKDKTIPFLIYSTYFASIFKILEISEISFFTILLLIFVIKEMFSSGFRTNFIIGFVFLFIFTILAQLLNGSFNIPRNIKFFEFFFYVYISVDALTSTKCALKYENILWAIIYGVIISSIFRLLDSSVFNISKFVIEKSSDYSSFSRVFTRFSGLLNDPNYYAINVHVAIVSTLFLCRDKKISYIAMLFILAVLVIFAIMTGSKSAFLMLAFPFFLLFDLNIKQNKGFVNLILIGGVVGVLVLAFAGKIEFLNNIVTRLISGNTSLDSFTTGRTAIWRDYFAFFGNNKRSLIIGNGISAGLVNEKAAHNTYIDIIYHLGIIPGCIFIYLIVSYFKINKIKFKRDFINYAGIITVLVMYIFLSSLFDIDLGTNVIAMVTIYITQIKKGDISDEYKKSNLQITRD